MQPAAHVRNIRSDNIILDEIMTNLTKRKQKSSWHDYMNRNHGLKEFQCKIVDCGRVAGSFPYFHPRIESGIPHGPPSSITSAGGNYLTRDTLREKTKSLIPKCLRNHS
jgi:hypothetical protein